MSLTDARWQNYHEQIAKIPVGTFYSHPLMQRVMTLSGSDDYFKHLTPVESMFALSRFTEHPLLLNAARDRYGRKIHISSEKYLFQVSLMLRHVHPEGFSVLEIGGGYGGFCRALLLLCPDVVKYTMLDHVAMRRLSQFFLEGQAKVEFVDLEDTSKLFSRRFDLVVSNYCLSETPVEFRQLLYSGIFPAADRLFVIDGGKGDEPFLEELLAEMRKGFSSVEDIGYPVEYIRALLAKDRKRA